MDAPPMPNLRPAALTLCLIAAIATPLAVDAAKKRRPAAPPKPPAAPTACVDFNAHANADWLRANPVPGTGSTSALAALATLAQQQQRDLLEAAAKAPQNPVQRLLGDFWASGMDEAAVERDGANPVAPLLARIDAIRKPKDIAPAIAALHQVGIPVAFNFFAELDVRQLDTYMGYFAQGGTGLPGPEFYTRSDAEARALLGRYNGHVQKILGLAGVPADRVEAEARLVIDLETRIARASKTRAQLQTLSANFAPVPTKDFAKKFRNLQLNEFLKAQGVSATEVSMADAALFAQIDRLVGSLKPAQWQAYLRFQVGNAMAPYLSKAWRDADQDFHGVYLRGEIEPVPRWQRVLDAINLSAGAMLAHEYADRYLDAPERARAAEITDAVRDALRDAIDRNTWMDDAAKNEARAKLDRLKVEIGKPRHEYDFNAQPMGRGSFGGNILIASTWHHREEMKRIGKANADHRWEVLPQSPALLYDVAHNRLYLTAALLQAPVLDLKAPLAQQYGALGGMVGHELTHLVEGLGRRVDASGAVRDWWSPTTLGNWNQRGQGVAAAYGRLTYPGQPSLKVDGTRTLAENMADLSGVELAFAALQKAQPQATPAQHQDFFRGWARVWAQQLAADAAATHAQLSVQAPGAWRGTLPAIHSPGFQKAFACKAGNPMFVPEAEQLSIWR